MRNYQSSKVFYPLDVKSNVENTQNEEYYL